MITITTTHRAKPHVSVAAHSASELILFTLFEHTMQRLQSTTSPPINDVHPSCSGTVSCVCCDTPDAAHIRSQTIIPRILYTACN